MNANRFTEKAQEALLNAQNRAESAHHPQVETLHLLSALLAQSNGVAPAILRLANVNPDDLRRRVDQDIATLPRVSGDAQISMSSALRNVVSRAQRDAGAMGDEYVSVEHLLLAIADPSNTDRAGDLLFDNIEPAEPLGFVSSSPK